MPRRTRAEEMQIAGLASMLESMDGLISDDLSRKGNDSINHILDVLISSSLTSVRLDIDRDSEIRRLRARTARADHRNRARQDDATGRLIIERDEIIAAARAFLARLNEHGKGGRSEEARRLFGLLKRRLDGCILAGEFRPAGQTSSRVRKIREKLRKAGECG